MGANVFGMIRDEAREMRSAGAAMTTLKPEEREQCDRADLVIKRALAQGWITFNTATARASLHATLRIALNMEVEAGGPYLVRADDEETRE